MSLKGNIASLNNFSAALRRLPRVLAQKIAADAAPEITALAQQTFAAGEDAYGGSWSPGKEGQKITLRKSGSLARYVKYVAIGTKLRVALGVAYAKYQVGRRPVTPRQGEPLPVAYVRALRSIAEKTIREELGR